jgi:hypothetical protein
MTLSWSKMWIIAWLEWPSTEALVPGMSTRVIRVRSSVDESIVVRGKGVGN